MASGEAQRYMKLGMSDAFCWAAGIVLAVRRRHTMLQRFAMWVTVAAVTLTVACAQTDPGITTAVKSKFAADDTVKAYQINVDTDNAVVTLTGTVESPAAKERAVMIARQTNGVRDVVDRITVGNAANIRDRVDQAAATTGQAADRAGNAITDAAITAGVKSKFLADTSVSGLKIDVDTKNGVVTLNGTAATRAEADRAVSLARDTSGVTRVVNNLRVGNRQ
jgi:hyperosmotically inducible protein